jgi:hypothetical protein
MGVIITIIKRKRSVIEEVEALAAQEAEVIIIQ